MHTFFSKLRMLNWWHQVKWCRVAPVTSWTLAAIITAKVINLLLGTDWVCGVAFYKTCVTLLLYHSHFYEFATELGPKAPPPYLTFICLSI